MMKSFLVKLQARNLHLFKTETPAQVFPSEFARFSRISILNNIIICYIKYVLLKNLTIFTAKFMWTAASGINDSKKTYLAGCKFIVL